MSKGIVNGLFGIFFNLATAALIVGLLLIAGALRGSVEAVWVARTGIILEILGVSLFALEYVGVAQQGQSPLRWWLRKLIHDDITTPTPALWPRQMVLLLGVGTLVTGLGLQLLSSWNL